VSEPKRKVICTNRKARHQYRIEETIEAGLVLRGPEVKSLRAGKAHLTDSYARVRNGEMFLFKAYIGPYEQASRENLDSERERKLLLHRREIDRLAGKVRERGFTLIPLQMYFLDGRAKVELALARGKRTYDKRQAIADRESKVRLRRVLKRRARETGGT
jgi:SsrA-binding protein